MNLLVLVLTLFFHFFSITQISAQETYSALEPHSTGYLQVDETHQIYWEVCGNPKGFPVIVLHGGPGSGIQENATTFFDPKFYRIILFDQRGCGKSLPQASLVDNTTWDLVEDINKLREFFAIDRCLLFGGSWGSTLSLAYAIKYPEHVSGMILRGIFLSRQTELDWFYKEGANQLSKESWEIFTEDVSLEKQDDLILAYHEALHSDSYWTQVNAAAAWVLWEFANLQLVPDGRLNALINSKFLFYLFAVMYADQNRTFALIENHYFYNKCFFNEDNWIMNHIHKIQHIPSIIVQGQCDQICPWENAEELHLNWPNSTFILVPNAGHASTEPGVSKALVEATEKFKTLSEF